MLATRLSRSFYPPVAFGTAPMLRTYTAGVKPARSPISQVIVQDHQELERIKDIILSSGSKDEQERWQNQFTWELARHSIAEELVVYPAIERSIPDGKDMAEKDRAEHQEVKNLLYKFQGLKPGHQEYEETLRSLWGTLSQHIKEEEQKDLPRLEMSIPDDYAAELATSFERTKMFVPTRSHPMSPARPPFETVAGLLAAPIDKLRDAFAKFPK